MTDDDEDPNSLRNRNAALAARIVDAMQRPGELADDPDKAAADQAGYEDYYRRTGQTPEEPPPSLQPTGELVAELDRLLPSIDDAKLTGAAWALRRRACDRAIGCLRELLSRIPPSMNIVPDLGLSEAERRDRDARRERYQRGWLEAELRRVADIVEAADLEAAPLGRS